MSRSCDHVVQAALPNAKQMKSSLLFITNAAGKCGLGECAASGAEEAPIDCPARCISLDLAC